MHLLLSAPARSDRPRARAALSVGSGVLALAQVACHPRTDRIDLGLHDPSQVRVQLRSRSVLGDGPPSVTLEEGERGQGRAMLITTGRLLDRHDLESRVARADDGSLELHVARIPRDDEPPTLDPDYVKKLVVWKRMGSELRFENANLRGPGKWVSSDAATWRFDRAAPRLSIETHAALVPGTSGWVVNDDYIFPPSVTISTPMDNVRWARAVTIERKSTGWWLVAGAVVGGVSSATMFHLATRHDGAPNPFFVGLGIGTGTIALASAAFATVAFLRGDRETSHDLVVSRTRP